MRTKTCELLHAIKFARHQNPQDRARTQEKDKVCATEYMQAQLADRP